MHFLLSPFQRTPGVGCVLISRSCAFKFSQISTAGQWLKVANFTLDAEGRLWCNIWAVVWRLEIDSPLTLEKEACDELLESGERVI